MRGAGGVLMRTLVAHSLPNGSTNGSGRTRRATLPAPAEPAGLSRGELNPTGGGDPIPLSAPALVIGRRDGCDICLRFPEVSGRHCRLLCQDGFWYVEDLGSTNGTKLNGVPVERKRFVAPGDTLQVAKRRFTLNYAPPAGVPYPHEDADLDSVMGQSLLERAGLSRPKRPNGWVDWERE
jgi:adenylate cyclase